MEEIRAAPFESKPATRESISNLVAPWVIILTVTYFIQLVGNSVSQEVALTRRLALKKLSLC